MGYWSVFSTVDDLDYTYLVPGTPTEVLDALERDLPRPGRVVCQRISDGELEVSTVQHTPAWARFFLVPILLLTVRVTRRTVIAAKDAAEGTELRVKGRLDTVAAERLRSLRPESVRFGAIARA